ncbi:MAG TPA: NAD-dependent succinate-semialdehyde dehydrogenase [Patescibacteria group bacterium]|jgi:succinate-semialdehyde dehydrogenase/glutarate-semialdehyde dehydrogenase|nr:NAD-dependent succinate-semialdehyde dehydrogenase [Patescibacteria group bacterium]
MIDLSSVFHEKAFINGQWSDADSGATFDVRNPATGEVIGHVPNMGAAETDRAIEAAEQARVAWENKTGKERAAILKRWAQSIRDNLEPLAQLLTAEQGKPIAQARVDVSVGADYVDWFAEEAVRVAGETLAAHRSDLDVSVLKEPRGVTAAIEPWNFPAAMVTRGVAPALAAGCPVVLKPSEDTPFTALALAGLGEKAGIPPGVLNVVTGDRDAASTIGTELTTHAAVRAVTFTGSTRVGKILMSQCVDTLKHPVMELGGNAPFIVFESADVDKAVKGLLMSKFYNAGQACISPNRIYVHESRYDEFVQKFAEGTKTLKLGPGIDPTNDVGPLINELAVKKVEGLVNDAVAKGATIASGGARREDGSLFFQPTVLTGITSDMAIAAEEIFGPVAAIQKFKDEAEVVCKANNTPAGLAAYFYTNDMNQYFRVRGALKAGMVGVNEPYITGLAAPFHGIKESGTGTSLGHGIEEFLETKSVVVGGVQKLTL